MLSYANYVSAAPKTHAWDTPGATGGAAKVSTLRMRQAWATSTMISATVVAGHACEQRQIAANRTTGLTLRWLVHIVLPLHRIQRLVSPK